MTLRETILNGRRLVAGLLSSLPSTSCSIERALVLRVARDLATALSLAVLGNRAIDQGDRRAGFDYLERVRARWADARRFSGALDALRAPAGGPDA